MFDIMQIIKNQKKNDFGKKIHCQQYAKHRR